MKNIFRITLSSILAASALVPLCYGLYKVCNNICATKSSISAKTNKSVSVKAATEMGHPKFFDSEDSRIEYWVRCYKDDETGEKYGVIDEFRISDRAIINVWHIPSSAQYDGSTYPITKIDFANVKRGYHEIVKCLSFRDANNLQEIGDSCFEYQSEKHGPQIQLVDFRGAHNLKIIGKRAFYNQTWNSSIATGDFADCIDWDLSLTQIEKIGDEAFRAPQNDNVENNTFNHLILPSTFKRFGERAFDYEKVEQRILRFNRVYINTPAADIITKSTEIKESFFGFNCLPYVIGKDSSNEIGIITQNVDQLEKLKQCDNHEQSDGRVITDNTYALSRLTFTHKTTWPNDLHIAGQSQFDGADPALFRVNSLDGFDDVTIKCDLITANSTVKDKVHLVKTESPVSGELCYNIQWPSGMPPGIYYFSLRAIAEPTSGLSVNYANLALSGLIKLTIAQPTLTFDGETTFMVGSNLEKGNSTHKFSFDYGSQYINYSEIGAENFSYYIEPLSAEWQSEWTIEAKYTNGAEPFSCAIFWDLTKDKAGASVGRTFVFNLIGKIETKSHCFIYASQQFSLTISSNSYNAVLRKNTLDFQASATEPQKVELVYKFGQYGDLLRDQLPKLTFSGDDTSIPAITIAKNQSQVNPAGEYTYTITVDPTKLNTGTYYVWVFFDLYTKDEPVSLGYNYPLYSDILTIRKTNDVQIKTPYLTSGSQTLYGKKNICGQDSKAWTFSTEHGDTTKWSIDTSIAQPIEFVPAGMETETGRVSKLGYTAIDNNTAFYVNWTEKFAEGNEWCDLFYANVIVHLKSEETNFTSTIVMPITFVSTNVGEIVTSCPLTINALPMTAGEDLNQFKLSINGDSTLIETETAGTTEYSIDFSDSDLNENQLSLETVSTNPKAVHLKWSNNIPKGKHYFRVKAYNDAFYTSATSNNFCLDVQNSIKLADLPTLIDTVKDTPGQTEKPISVFLNNVEITDATFALLNAPSGISIDDKGIISWDGTTNIGTHSIQIEVSAVDGEGDKISTIAVVTIRVMKEDSKTNDNNWKPYAIGGGSAVGGAGAGTGGTILVSHLKKNKLSKKPGKK